MSFHEQAMAEAEQLRAKGEKEMSLLVQKGAPREIRRKDVEEQYYWCEKCKQVVLWKLSQTYIPNYTSLLWYRDKMGHRIRLL